MAHTPFHRQAEALFPYLPTQLLDILTEAWVDSGDLTIAIQEMRQHSLYETFFPGNRRDDGTLRFDEATYFSQVEGYTQVLRNFGIDPQLFRNRFVELITGAVTAQEFQTRVQRLYTQVLSRGDEIRQFYAENFGNGNISDAALLASAMDPNTDPLVFESQFRQAQIGGVAAEAGFDRTLDEVRRLADAGLDEQAARSFFNQAKSLLPNLGNLVARHNDPDDDFDLSELEDAVIFANPEQIRRMENLFANEASSFSPIAQLFRSGSSGQLTGLTER